MCVIRVYCFDAKVLKLDLLSQPIKAILWCNLGNHSKQDMVDPLSYLLMYLNQTMFRLMFTSC